MDLFDCDEDAGNDCKPLAFKLFPNVPVAIENTGLTAKITPKERNCPRPIQVNHNQNIWSSIFTIAFMN